MLDSLKGENGVLAARSGDVCDASRARRSHERYRGGDGAACWTRPSACGTSACGASSFDSRRGRGRTVLCTECRDDVLMACGLRWHQFSTCIALWFVHTICHINVPHAYICTYVSFLYLVNRLTVKSRCAKANAKCKNFLR